MEKLLARLLDQQAQVARTALLQPVEKTAYEFGRVSGLYQGLTMAIEALEATLADNDEDDT